MEDTTKRPALHHESAAVARCGDSARRAEGVERSDSAKNCEKTQRVGVSRMRYLALAAWDCSAPTCRNDRVVNADQTMQYRVRGATNAPEAASALAIKMKLDMDPESAAVMEAGECT